MKRTKTDKRTGIRRGIVASLVLLSLASPLLFSGCDESLRTSGDRPVLLSVETGRGLFTDTKTAYSGDVTGSTERINGSANDRVRVYSPQASRDEGGSLLHWADYTVAPTTPSSGSTSHQAAANPVSDPLNWGTGDHAFYGMYPSPATMTSFTFTDGTMTAQIPASVTFATPSANNPPDMRYATMLAAKTGVAPGSGVSLAFYPQYTCYEFEIAAGELPGVKINSFSLTTDTATGSGDLCGTYKVLKDSYFPVKNTTDASGAVTVTGGGKTVTVTFTGGLTLATATDKARFAVLALPKKHTGLKLTFNVTRAGETTSITRSLTLRKSGTDLEFNPYVKYRISGLSFTDNISDKTLPVAGEEIDWNWGLEVFTPDGVVWNGAAIPVPGLEGVSWQ